MRLRLFAAASAMLACSLVARADTVAGQTGGSLFATDGSSRVQQIGFTVLQSYTNVSVSAYLSSQSFTMDGSGTVYLTNQSGAGTTIANQVASQTVSGVPYATYTPTETSLFSGLSLDAGTYFLTIAGANVGIGFDVFTGGHAITTNSFSDATSIQSYAPASTFSSFGNVYQFDVNGTPVTAPTPEPSSLALLGTGVLGVIGAARRRFAA